MGYKLRRAVFSLVWFIVIIPSVFITSVIAGLMVKLDDRLRVLDPNWDPFHPFVNQAPPPSSAEPAPEEDDTYGNVAITLTGIHQGEPGFDVRVRPPCDDERSPGRRRRPS